MPSLVSFLLLTLLCLVQTALAARLPEMQTVGPLKAETAIQSNGDIAPPSGDASALPRADSASHAETAGAGTDAAQRGEPAPRPNMAGTPQEHEIAASPAQGATLQNPTDQTSPTQDAIKKVSLGEGVGNAQDENQGRGKTDQDAAAAIISGSRRPGIIEHQIVRANRGDKPDINLSYPSVGIRAIDANIRNWATGIADAFEETFASPGLYPDENRPRPELWCSYALSHPSDKALSITFEVWTYTGGAQGNLDVITLNYSLLTGQRLGLVDIFEDPDAALAIMSSWSRKELTPRLGGMRHEQYLRTGLNPVPENFASLTLIPSGIRINFQPYQVAPGMAGAQKVDIPLEELLPAHPLLLLWGK